jgi:hypothetical protein
LYVYDATGVLKGATVNQYVNNEELSFITVYGEMPETLFYMEMESTRKEPQKVLVSKATMCLEQLKNQLLWRIICLTIYLIHLTMKIT